MDQGGIDLGSKAGEPWRLGRAELEDSLELCRRLQEADAVKGRGVDIGVRLASRICGAVAKALQESSGLPRSRMLQLPSPQQRCRIHEEIGQLSSASLAHGALTPAG
jgi:hypothetical protein